MMALVFAKVLIWAGVNETDTYAKDAAEKQNTYSMLPVSSLNIKRRTKLDREI